MIEIWGGLLLGLAGSAHCVLMCGPFAAAVAPRGSRAVVHHGSRIATYAGLGAASGWLGSAVTSAGAGRILTMIAIVALVSQAAIRWRSPATSLGASVAGPVTAALRRLQQVSLRHPALTGIGAGIVNGLLPCGLVYAALIASVGFAGSLRGAALMIAFGVGTTPAVVLAARLTRLITTRRPALNRFAPVALVLVAILIAVRGWSGLPLPVHSH